MATDEEIRTITMADDVKAARKYLVPQSDNMALLERVIMIAEIHGRGTEVRNLLLQRYRNDIPTLMRLGASCTLRRILPELRAIYIDIGKNAIQFAGKDGGWVHQHLTKSWERIERVLTRYLVSAL